MSDPTSRITLITGANEGIGIEIALKVGGAGNPRNGPTGQIGHNDLKK
jgi:NADP-dependent 3-hydroxy acid dehydrogenase YdfG